MNTKLHALADANGRSLSFFMTAGQVSDYTGAAALLEDMPSAQWLLGDHATNRSGMTSAVTGVAAASRSCSAASKTGTASPPATIAARSPSSPPSLSLPPSSSGCSQRVLTLITRTRDHIRRESRTRCTLMEEAVTKFATSMEEHFGCRAIDVDRAQCCTADGNTRQSWSAMHQRSFDVSA